MSHQGTPQDDFAGLPENDLEEAIAAPKAPIDSLPGLPPAFTETCPSCRGSGQFISYTGRVTGQCFKCKGKGTLAFKTSRQDRAAAKSSKTRQAASRAQRNLDDFKTAEPIIWAWMDGNDFPFAVSMREAVAKYGHLTERQADACNRMIAKRDEAKAAAVARVTNAVTIDMMKIEAAFAKAGTSLKAPKLRVAGLTLSFAKATSANAGAIYVKTGDRYLGKIKDAKFIRSRDCADEQEARLVEVATDPLGAAIAYGRLTGNCACCGRGLTDPESVARGIGPVCAANYGWGA